PALGVAACAGAATSAAAATRTAASRRGLIWSFLPLWPLVEATSVPVPYGSTDWRRARLATSPPGRAPLTSVSGLAISLPPSGITFADDIEFAREAESLGYDSAWVAEV